MALLGRSVTTPDAICFKDGNGKWLLANNAMLRLFSLENIEYIGKTDEQLAELREDYREVLLACKQTDEITWKKKALARSREVLSVPDGTSKVFDVTKVPLFESDGKRKGIVAIRQDITDSIAITEEIKKKNKKIQESNIALRVLLDQHATNLEQMEKHISLECKRLIFPYIRLLSQTKLEKDALDYVQLITDHLQTITDSFCTKLDNPNIGLSPKEFLIADLVRQGKSSTDIARLLGLTIRTVEVYRSNIRKKLNISGKKINLCKYLRDNFK